MLEYKEDLKAEIACLFRFKIKYLFLKLNEQFRKKIKIKNTKLKKLMPLNGETLLKFNFFTLIN